MSPTAERLFLPGMGWRNLAAYSVLASNDAVILGLGAWPPPFFAADQIPAAGQVVRAPFGPLFAITNYLITFDTSFVTQLQSVVRAILRLGIRLGAADADGMWLHNDNYSWGALADSGDYVAANQPGADGRIPLADIPPVGDELSLVCRHGRVARGSITQYRLTLTDGMPVGDNATSFFTMASGEQARLDLLVADHVGLWEMRG